MSATASEPSAATTNGAGGDAGAVETTATTAAAATTTTTTTTTATDASAPAPACVSWYASDGTIDTSTAEQPDGDNKLAPFNPTNAKAVDEALEMAKLTADDVLLDVGCGDGRLLITAAQRYGVRGIGIEYDKRFVQRAVEAVESSKLPDGMVTITHADALKVDWAATGATVLFIYLTPTGITRARDKLEAIRAAGVRIIASVFKVKDWEPTTKKSVRGLALYLYDAPSSTTTTTTSATTSATDSGSKAAS